MAQQETWEQWRRRQLVTQRKERRRNPRHEITIKVSIDLPCVWQAWGNDTRYERCLRHGEVRRVIEPLMEACAHFEQVNTVCQNPACPHRELPESVLERQARNRCEQCGDLLCNECMYAHQFANGCSHEAQP